MRPSTSETGGPEVLSTLEATYQRSDAVAMYPAVYTEAVCALKSDVRLADRMTRKQSVVPGARNGPSKSRQIGGIQEGTGERGGWANDLPSSRDHNVGCVAPRIFKILELSSKHLSQPGV